MPPEFRNIFMQVVVLSDGGHLYIHKFDNNESMLSRLIFYLNSVNFLFLLSIVLMAHHFYWPIPILFPLLNLATHHRAQLR